MNPQNARRGFYARAEKRRCKSSARQPKKNSFLEEKMNNRSSWPIIIAVIVVIGLLVAVFFISRATLPAAEAPAAETTSKAPAAEADSQNPIPYAQAETCQSIVGPNDTTQYVTFDLNPNTTVAGDFEANINGNWIILHDNGIGQYELYRNIGTEIVKMRGHWGGGCLKTVDVKTLVNGEYQNPNHSDFVRAHLVTFTDAKTYSEVMYEKANLPIE